MTILCAALTFATSASPLQAAADGEAQRLGFVPARLRALRSGMQKLVTDGRVHGLVAYVERHGTPVFFEGFGVRIPGGEEPMKKDTIFQVMSMTKPVTAVAVALLVERGLVRLNDPVTEYLPEFADVKMPDGNKPANPIRVRHLLNHSSGISSDMPIDDDDRARMTLAEFVDLIRKQPLASEPGTAERYSGPGTSVAGRIVEVVSGTRFEAFCESEVFRPLGMKDTHLFVPAKDTSRLSGVAVREGGRLKAWGSDPARPGSRFANPAGGLYSTAADFASFQRVMLAKRKGLLSRAMIRLMTTPGPRLPGSGEEFGFGLGWSVVRGPGPTRALLPEGTFGHTGAFGTYAWSDPTNGIVGVFMTNKLGGSDRELDLFRTLVYASFEP